MFSGANLQYILNSIKDLQAFLFKFKEFNI
jgi:hypothetical protein